MFPLSCRECCYANAFLLQHSRFQNKKGIVITFMLPPLLLSNVALPCLQMIKKTSNQLSKHDPLKFKVHRVLLLRGRDSTEY
jgi:hypothetical protein